MKCIFLFLFLISLLSPDQGTATLSLNITGLKSDKGVIRVLLFKGESGLPDDRSKAVRSASVKISGTQGDVVFKDLQSGTYAISVFHDSENSGQLRTNFLGIPRDGYGFSNNAMGTFGPPHFGHASFDVTAGRNEHQIKLRH